MYVCMYVRMYVCMYVYTYIICLSISEGFVFLSSRASGDMSAVIT